MLLDDRTGFASHIRHNLTGQHGNSIVDSQVKRIGNCGGVMIVLGIHDDFVHGFPVGVNVLCLHDKT